MSKNKFQNLLSEIGNLNDSDFLYLAAAMEPRRRILQKNLQPMPSEQALIIAEAAGQKKMAHTLNTDYKEFAGAWAKVGGRMDEIKRAINCDPGTKTVKQIREATAEMIGELENLRLIITKINSSLSPIWIDVDGLQPYIDEIMKTESYVREAIKLPVDLAVQRLKIAVDTGDITSISNFDPSKVAYRGNRSGKKDWRNEIQNRWAELERDNPDDYPSDIISKLKNDIAFFDKNTRQWFPRNEVSVKAGEILKSLSTPTAVKKPADYKSKLFS